VSFKKAEAVPEAQMQGEVRQRITRLCAQAADEQDPEKFRKIVHEMNLLLQEKQDRLDKAKSAKAQRDK
jgi:hypothetical protein